jgi:hypothetical protein
VCGFPPPHIMQCRMRPVFSVGDPPGLYPYYLVPSPPYDIPPYLKTKGLWEVYVPPYLKTKELWEVHIPPYISVFENKGVIGGRRASRLLSSHGMIVRQKGEIICKTGIRDQVALRRRALVWEEARVWRPALRPVFCAAPTGLRSSPGPRSQR